MKVKKISSFLWSITLTVVSFVVCATYSLAQILPTTQPSIGKPEDIKTAVAVSVVNAPVKEHPLLPVIRWAEAERPKIAKLNDYSAIVTKQECVGGVVQEAQIMEVKVRHKPFSVYIKFLYPKSMTGQEAIYVDGKYNNKIVGHGVGVQKAFGTLRLDPIGAIAMRGNKYPITEMGILNLTDKLLEVGKKDAQFGECTVNYAENVKLDDRVCTMIQVTHPIPRSNFIFNIARIFVDKELNMPIRYESYDWPKKEGANVTLIEAYTYQRLKLNNGFTDIDFDHKNPAYSYPGE
ncbi:MAG: DUF1571 domain-containing protein [Planctomycetaceae bacterium]|jgi:hypothetical protein|nr:DUF1571 domain-containing protein [Planctomycetaceae bacterium]